jgi:hypothetical protein
MGRPVMPCSLTNAQCSHAGGKGPARREHGLPESHDTTTISPSRALCVAALICRFLTNPYNFRAIAE